MRILWKRRERVDVVAKPRCLRDVSRSGHYRRPGGCEQGRPPERGALTRDAVIPYAVGVDIACRMKLAVLDPDWKLTSVTSNLKDRASAQLGTSGSGNHFVEFGQLTVSDNAAGLSRGEYFALLSHAGSRGTGAQIAQHYSQLARELHPELPQELSYLA